MSTTRAISASRQRTGSRSPRRAWVVRFTPTRSSTSPESNSPSNGSLIQVRRPPGIAGTSHKSQDRTRKPPRLPWRGIPRTGRDASVSPGRAAGRTRGCRTARRRRSRSEEHTSELQSHSDLVCRLLLEKKKKKNKKTENTQKHRDTET